MPAKSTPNRAPSAAPEFRRRLLRWFRKHGRDLPWRRTRDPYAVLVSEFMLQQTQVSRVESYWPRLLERFPTVGALARARPSSVRESREGLGYYRRAANLHKLARVVTDEQAGTIPSDIVALRQLPGIGRYTAGAVASFAFERAQPAVDTKRDYQLEWLAPVGLAMHCCGNPTLIDGLTKPHNPGLAYDIFAYWNQLRLDANEVAHNDIGRQIQRPVNDYNSDGEFSPPPVGPAFAESWDDWGPFYTQTYMAFYGVDSSTVEMCSTTCDGRIGSKTAQYITFYSSAEFWIDNRNGVLDDQAEIFRRGLTSAPRPNCCDSPELIKRGFTEDSNNWMVEYPAGTSRPSATGLSPPRNHKKWNAPDARSKMTVRVSCSDANSICSAEAGSNGRMLSSRSDIRPIMLPSRRWRSSAMRT